MLTRTSLLLRRAYLPRALLARASSSAARSPSNPSSVPNPPSLSSSPPSPSSSAPSTSSDPFPLPLSAELAPQFEGLAPTVDAASETSEELLPLRKDRPAEPVDTLRARLTYQTRKRGTLESDLLLSTFAREHLALMDEQELKAFDRLLDEPDWDIYYWAIGKREPPARWAGAALLEKLKVHARNEGRVVRRMPDLWEGRTSAQS